MEARPVIRRLGPWLQRFVVVLLAALGACLLWQAYGAWLFSADSHVG